MTFSSFVKNLQQAKFPDTFNPYRDRCERCDLHDAVQIRTETLSSVLYAAADIGIDSVWVGRDLGYRGGRRSGLPFTDDIRLSQAGAYWNIPTRRSTKDEPIAERTAAVVWKALQEIEQSVFLWNVFPLHPHLPGTPFCNRAHNRKEREWGATMLAELMELLSPATVIPVGKDAASVVCAIDGTNRVFPVRHPSYGGQSEFLRKISHFYNS